VVKKGACARCRIRKVKCEWIDGASVCKACESNGLQAECITTGIGSKLPSSEGTVQRATRSQSIPPSISMVIDSISAAEEGQVPVQESTHVVGRKRSYSQTTSTSWASELEHQPHTRTRRNRLDSGPSTSSVTRISSASMKTTLEAITEFDEDSQLTGHTAVSTGTDASLNSQQYEKAMAFASLVCTVSSNDSDNSNMISDDSEDSDMEIVIDPKVKPGRKPTGQKPVGRKLSSSKRVEGDESDPDNGDEYDPATCGVFAYLGYYCEKF
jgi:Fungal Zn(2)-Cys(6) binuclear cluster domain